MKFRITWPSNLKTEVEVSECVTVDRFAMQKWGFPTAREVEEAFGVKLELCEDQDEPTTEMLNQAEADRENERRVKAAQIEARKAHIAAIS